MMFPFRNRETIPRLTRVEIRLPPRYLSGQGKTLNRDLFPSATE
jgi:hypothetical protein